jgi:two-component system cell cycle response regulator CtrA
MDDLVEALRDEVERLRSCVRELDSLLAPEIAIPPEYRLTATEQRLFACLSARALCTKRHLHAAAYGHWIDEAPDETVIESHVCKLRRKIKPFGFQIKSERFAGYRMLAPGAANG